MSDGTDELLIRVQNLERELSELRAREAIRDLLARYSRALDWLDEAQLDSVFFDDADVDYGFFKGSGKDFKPVVMQIEHATGRRWHFGAQVTIDLDGDAADVMSYGIAIGAQTEAGVDGADLPLFMGYYLDRVERREVGYCAAQIRSAGRHGGEGSGSGRRYGRAAQDRRGQPAASGLLADEGMIRPRRSHRRRLCVR